ncbi:Uu.00g141750.m01.CDS01 [Anthostomella pinea]|uniref:Uu.00g141750.m01.CDS01 n=1 Tax=Anthostomella pinea TaxID=933095 RepID=A0AAI8VR55_9PEZI|nr:Uu.00g141750.m01.CDS01 [Anthostomella pinea]
MAASRRYLVSITSWIERCGELDCLKWLLSHDHGLKLHFPYNDTSRVYENLDTSRMFGLGRVEVYPCSIAKGGFVACDVNVVFDTDPSSIKRAFLGWLVIAARRYDDSTIDASHGGVKRH